jgi:hypothetical protein
MAMKRTQIFLSDKQIEKIEKEKKETGLCKSEILRRALDQYLKNGGGGSSRKA